MDHYIDSLLSDLNPAQRQAVTTPPGPVLVLAGPGSGKTRVLTHRVAYSLTEQGVSPHALLAVTFTNKAAREMQARVSLLVGEATDNLWLGTFHSICARILRRESKLLPFTGSFVIFDEDDQEKLVKQALKELNLDPKQNKPASMLAGISDAKNRMLLPSDLPIQTYRDELLRKVYIIYERLLQANNGVDFDDLLLKAVLILRENPGTLERYQHRFRTILVDEFQDTNAVQYELLRLLAGKTAPSLFVVGDEDQSIYRWRGADYHNVLRFEHDYSDCIKVVLEQNYRSTQTVLDAARAVIDRNPNRTVKKLFTQRGAGEKITLYTAEDDQTEAQFVVDSIRRDLRARAARGGDFAIMYRTNAQSRLLEEAFLREGLSYRLVGAQRFYGRMEIKDLIAYLRLVFNPSDELSLERIINVPGRDIGAKTFENLVASARMAGCSAGEALLDMADRRAESVHWKAFPTRKAETLAAFAAQLQRWMGYRETLDLPALFDRIVDESGYSAYIQDGSEEGESRWENVQELRRLAYEFSQTGLAAFLETLALVSDQDTVPEKSDSPTLLTLHAAKGLEFTRVFIIGLDEGTLPHSRSLSDPEEMEEERRLFYVGMTRAKDHLTLVRADRRRSFGSYEDSLPSRFLRDIPRSLVTEAGYSRQRASQWQTQPQKPSMPMWSSSQPRERSAAIVEPQFKAGLRVEHPVYGEGLVIQCRVDNDGEETVDVAFESVGFKRMVASLAKLRIISKK
jgi:DNA helicase-2/ATP-dependent DNA helicase PcrA